MARQELLRLPKSGIPRSALAEVGNLARRAGLFSYGLKLLYPVIYPERPNAAPATVQERASYAGLLAKCGLSGEALQLLGKATEKTAEVELFAGFAEMNRWEYAKAIPHFMSYLKKFKQTHYERAVAELNLAAAYVFDGQYEEATALLRVLLQRCEENNWIRLRVNSLELSAQAAIRAREWESAEKWLNEAMAMSAEDSTSRLFVEKWRAIVRLKAGRVRVDRVEELKAVREKALLMEDWETVRDCDFHLANALQQAELASKVFFGTPYASYRGNLAVETSDWYSVPARFVWCSSSGPSSDGPTLDLQAGRELTGSTRLKPAQAMHRLLLALASDRYRPQPGGALFAMVFPGEVFNPMHSPQRIFQLAYRLRAWFRAHDVPLDILAKAGSYSLFAKGEYNLLYARPKQGRVQSEAVANGALLEMLKQAWPYKSFSSSQAIEKLELSPRAVKALLREAVQTGKMQSSGRGRSVLYRFAK